jgi:hypothetical protein
VNINVCGYLCLEETILRKLRFSRNFVNMSIVCVTVVVT